MTALSTVVSAGQRRESLVALRDHVAATLEVAEPQYVAALARQLRDVLAELDTLTVPERSAADDLKAKRDARLGAAKVPKRSSRAK